MGGSKVDSKGSVKRRNRLTVVCTNCKRRKNKCDRKKPCSNCIKFGNADTCIYVTNLKSANYQGGNPPLENIDNSRTTKTSSIAEPKFVTKSLNELISHEALPAAECVNLSPNGYFVEVKRSAVTLFAPFNDEAIAHRDLYLEALLTFRGIAIDMTTNTLKGSKKYRQNPSLPESFKPLSIFDADGDPLSSDSTFRQHQMIHKSLFDKYGKYRKDDATKCDDASKLLGDNLPKRNYFFDHVLTLFEMHIFDMIPIFDMELLKYDINLFYDKWETNEVLSTKEFDHAVCCVILLITKLCILSIHFSKLPSELHEPLTRLDTTKYIAIVHHFLFEMKSLRKCTLMQLQAFILLRFYHWCGPEDGDGNNLQQSRIMFGTIVASCQEMGISWMSLLEPDIFWFELFPQSRPSPTIMSAAEYKRVYKMLWSYVVYWDRKMSLINGQECLIGKTAAYDITGKEISWHQRLLALDHIIMKMSGLMNDIPTKVNVHLLKQEWNNANQLFQEVKGDENKYTHLTYEYQMMLDLFMLCLLHIELLHYERVIEIEAFHRTVQLLWDKIVHLACNCYNFFYEQHDMDPYCRFYTNRIVGVVADKLCTLIPSFILRMNRFGKMGFEERNDMVKFLFGICSMYYNELGFDYYRCFVSMFTAKISYKILNRPPNKDPLRVILEFLLCQLEKESDEALTIIHYIPALVKIHEILKLIPNSDRDVVRVWNSEVFPVGQSSTNFGINLHKELLSPFLVDRYAKSFNIFASFYDHASSQLAEDAQNTSANRNLNGALPKSDSQEPPIGKDPLTWDSSVNPNLDEGNLELLQEMFEPLDFISFF
ncbi:OAF3 (YKR064W) [Zygosaccharomyces parabailii]|nr:OAF3 (YKR064W) [Zygosaccharomyces parabailii]CDH09269.1 probable Oleate activated transcription factor 3 [Zygosaccharomyces bailii ISA1307]